MRLYDLRHAMATMALQGGANLKALSEVLGHSRPDTTLIHYQHVVMEQHRQAIDSIPIIPQSFSDGAKLAKKTRLRKQQDG